MPVERDSNPQCANYQGGRCLARTKTLHHGSGYWPVDLTRGMQVQASCPFPLEARVGNLLFASPVLSPNLARQQTCRDFAAEPVEREHVEGNEDLAFFEGLRATRLHHDSENTGESGGGWLAQVLLGLLSSAPLARPKLPSGQRRYR